jgi:hypothetical protein
MTEKKESNIIRINARGKVIETFRHILEKSPVYLEFTQMDSNNGNEFILPFDENTVHKFLDYLSGYSIPDTNLILDICKYMGIKSDVQCRVILEEWGQFTSMVYIEYKKHVILINLDLLIEIKVRFATIRSSFNFQNVHWHGTQFPPTNYNNRKEVVDFVTKKLIPYITRFIDAC